MGTIFFFLFEYDLLFTSGTTCIRSRGGARNFLTRGLSSPTRGLPPPPPAPPPIFLKFGVLKLGTHYDTRRFFSREANFVCSNSIDFLLVPVEELVRQKKKSLCAKIIAYIYIYIIYKYCDERVYYMRGKHYLVLI